MFMKLDEMKFGAVTFVWPKQYPENARRNHALNVARHFRDHAGGGDGKTDAIAIDDRGLRQRKWGRPEGRR